MKSVSIRAYIGPKNKPGPSLGTIFRAESDFDTPEGQLQAKIPQNSEYQKR